MVHSWETPSFDSDDVAAEIGGDRTPRLGRTFSVDPLLSGAPGATVGGLEFRPSVVIGLGGTGIESVRRAKRMLLERVGPVPTIRFLYIDADTAAFADRPGLPRVDASEQCFVGGDQIAPIINQPQGNKWLLDQLPKVDKGYYRELLRGDGAGQVRAVGRVAVLGSLGTVIPAIKDAIRQVRDMGADLTTRFGSGEVTVSNDLEIYIVASLAGGAGSGMFLDVALLAHHLSTTRFDEEGNAETGAKVVGVFALPEAFEQKVRRDQHQVQRMHANAYAAIKELQTFLDTPHQRPLEVAIDATGGRMALSPNRRIFDACYLIDYKNQAGKRLTKTEDVFEVIARLLLHENASPFRGYADTARRNLGVLQNAKGCPATGRNRNSFSSFGCTALRYPVGEILRFCTWSTLQELVRDVLLGTVPPTELRNAEVLSFLNDHDLNEQGRSDQVIERLLVDPRTRGPINAASEGVAPTFGARLSRPDFVRELRGKSDAFAREALPQLQNLVQENLAHYLGRQDDQSSPLQRWLEAFLARCLSRFGCRGAEDIWTTLRIALEGERAEMIAENEAWAQSQRKNVSDELGRAFEQLLAMSFVAAAFSKRDERLRHQAVDALNALIDGDLRTLARTLAAKVFNEALNIVRAQQTTLQTFRTQAVHLDQFLENKRQSLLNEAHRDLKHFVVELDVTDADHMRHYFASHRADVREVFAAAAAEHKGEEALFLHLLGKSERDLINVFTRRVADRYQPALDQTSVAEFVTKERKETDSLDTKLEALFDLCEPLWSTQPPQVNLPFDEVVALGCKPIPAGDGGAVDFPPSVRKWVQRYTANPPNLVATTTPYEISLVRYVHGARAWYLNDAGGWKSCYEKALAEGLYPLHLARGFEELPDPMPDRAAAEKEAFALGLALGFIAKRGDDFFFNLQVAAPAAHAVDTRYEVPWDTEWRTVFGGVKDRVIPDAAQGDGIAFSFARRKPPGQHHLGQGRGAALRAFNRQPAMADLVRGALRQYLQGVGSDAARTQLIAYAEHLETLPLSNATLKKQINEEARLIRHYADERLE